VLGAEATGADTVIDTAGVDTITTTITRNLLNYASIENLTLLSGNINGIGNALKNTIIGSTGNNNIDGRLGNDTLSGGAGSDSLVGGRGIDTETGGAGRDFFIFNAPLSSANRDVIMDFNHLADTFCLAHLVMRVFHKTGPLDPDFFFVGTKAHDADDHIIYNKATGALFYDSNGDHAGGVTQLATLTNKPALQANDFLVI
jgi:Ca2+-binding RTX toxin-like protein